MELILLTVPDCPSAAAFRERLATSLAGHPGIAVTLREIADELAAGQASMHGSPTLLINGTDPFATPGQAASVSCRLYRDDTGRTGPAPSVEALRQAIAAAGDA